MDDFLTLTCPSCGAKLGITNDITKFACKYCGMEHIVKRGDGAIYLSPISEKLEGIKIGADRTASELALARLNNEINDLRAKVDSVKMPRPVGKISSSIIGIALFLGGLIFFCPSLSIIQEGESGAGITLLILGLVPIGLGINIIRINRLKTRKANARLKELEEVISLKVEELEKHKRIVSTF